VMRLDFVVAGAQKAGTSTIDAYLRSHPEIGMARVKETHFFDCEQLDWINPDYTILHNFFDQRRILLYGESTPVTLYWTPAQYRMREYNRDLKFVLIFRDPIDRAYSNWRMVRRFTLDGKKTSEEEGPEPLLFKQAIRAGRDRMLTKQEVPGLNRWSSYIERGLYALQIEHLLRIFPRRQILYLNYDDLSRNPSSILDQISEFLGVRRGGFSSEMIFELKGSENFGLFEDPTLEDIDYLGKLYRSDLQKFAALTQIDVSAWTAARYI
jgi:hypothetical protein